MIEGCRLCRNKRQLRKSHIISEFLYKAVYDEKHSALVIAGDPRKRVETIQKGFREHLLCDECEQLLGKNESYVEKVLFGGNITIRVTGSNDEIFIAENIDYSRFKLFQLSILWRASVSSNPFFSLVDLGPHKEKIRKMILDEKPGPPTQYGCILTHIACGDESFDVIRKPDRIKINGHICYRFLMGGFRWVFVVSSHSQQARFAQFFMKESGSVPVFKEDVKDLGFLQADFEATRHRVPDVLKIARRRGLDVDDI